MSVLRRRLAVDVVLERVRERWGADAAAHNAGLMVQFEPHASLRQQVLQEFAAARRPGTR